MTVIQFPTGIDVAGKNKVQFVPTLADPANPTLAEIEAGFPIECALDGFVPKGEQSTTTQQRYCLAEEIEALGKVSNTIEPLKYVYDPQNPDKAEGMYAHYAKLTPGLTGYLIDRRGLAYDTVPYAAGQFVDVYPVTLGHRNRTAVEPTTKDSAQKYTVEQTVAISGPVKQDRKIVGP